MDARFVERTLHSTTRQIPCSICPLFFPASLSPGHSRQLQPQLDHEGQPPSQDLLPSYQQYIYMRIDHRIMGTRVWTLNLIQTDANMNSVEICDVTGDIQIGPFIVTKHM